MTDRFPGRSTIQNEIVGDLDAEFGSLPDSSEDTHLEDLCSTIQNTFNGQLGRRSRSLVGKMISSKMPGGFELTAVRDYLSIQWGLGPGRQDAVLVSAIACQPAARLGTTDAAKAFWSAAVKSYAAERNLALGHTSSDSGLGSSSGVTIDPKAIEALQRDQRAVNQQILAVYAKQLNIDFASGNQKVLELGQRLDVLQADLDLWNLEHGAEYAQGIRPIFEPQKARTYDSSWNWALQDLLKTFHELAGGAIDVRDIHTQWSLRSQNRSSPRLINVMKYMLTTNLAKQSRDPLAVEQWLSELIEDCEMALSNSPVARRIQSATAPHTEIDSNGVISYTESNRSEIRKLDAFAIEKTEASVVVISEWLDTDDAAASTVSVSSQSDSTKVQCEYFLHIQRKISGFWRACRLLTEKYLDSLDAATSGAMSFVNKNVLLTGSGKGSIGVEILQGLLSGGARVVVTTSSYSPKVNAHYQSIYTRFGARGSRLIVLPFNQASQQDVEALVAYIYNLEDCEWDLDHVIPFAAMSEHTRGIDDINSRSELAHRLMLTNTLRLLGAIKRHKESRRITSRPAQVILPFSPNHGVFGNDGLYAESKLGLEALLEKWHSEDWADYLTVCGAVIGWTRGTALMADNDLVSEGIERLGANTFSQKEMAYNILGLMTSDILEASQTEPLLADLSGGLSMMPDLKEQITRIRQEISETSTSLRMKAAEINMDRQGPTVSPKPSKITPFQRRANIKYPFPKLPDFRTEIEPLTSLRDMVDLDRVVVIVGFAEVGPYGNARTRWEMEAHGEFSLEGCIEMAWIMGLIEHRIIESKSYVGWIDKKSGEPIADMDVKARYESQILAHTGIRLIESRSLDGSDPATKQFLHEVEIQEDLVPFEAPKETVQDLRREHGDKITVLDIEGSDQSQIILKKGARLLIPKASKFEHTVGGQVPTGWCARTYGISEDIVNQVDPATLYALVCTVEALISAGITDPYEFYKYIHVSELGTCVGSGFGGASSLQGIFKERFLDQSVQKDVLAESFINTGSAWINMLLLSSSGPNITPVGACATAIESMDVGYESIVSGKAKTVLVGGYDYLAKDVSYEFANMKATINAEKDMACGRTPKEMSRPATSTRNGFVEAEGAGIQILTTASLALEMGLPIHGVLALTRTASDKAGRSLPAPGRGILTTSREVHSKFDPPFMDIEYRRRCISLRMKQINETEASEISFLEAEISSCDISDPTFDVKGYRAHRVSAIVSESARQIREARNSFGNEFWKRDPRIAPIRGALATWGLTIDDLDVASFHGTSTVKNELNESEVIQTQLSQLGRTPGNPILGVFQKYLTGHPKGAAGAWMLNGCLQILDSGLVPGNRNADNIDKELEKHDYIVFPNQNIQMAGGVKAFSVTSFGFGQKGAQAIGVHPKYLFATLDEGRYKEYCGKVKKRQQKAYQYFHNALLTKTMFRAKEAPPYEKSEETAFLSDPSARLPMGKKLD